MNYISHDPCFIIALSRSSLLIIALCQFPIIIVIPCVYIPCLFQCVPWSPFNYYTTSEVLFSLILVFVFLYMLDCLWILTLAWTGLRFWITL